jgi:CubicO group peptidase (beta-lactamase class C family)
LTESLEAWANVGVRYVAPGGRSQYSNLTYDLLGALIEHVEGLPLAEVFRSGVLAHDGLDRMITQVDERPTEPLAHPLTEHHPAELAAAFDAGGGFLPSGYTASFGASGNVASDPASLARWMYLLYGGSLVSDASLREMTEAGYGMWKEDVGWGGSGWVAPGYAAYFNVRPDQGIVAVCMTNKADIDDDSHANLITLCRALADRADA